MVTYKQFMFLCLAFLGYKHIKSDLQGPARGVVLMVPAEDKDTETTERGLHPERKSYSMPRQPTSLFSRP